ncbi:MAG TPA: proton-conducting transporter membrane subunit, partial [Actinomycetota bacterium]|nr:proton-conducting transporter membrane subunit [Actinomycetota bacterium]
MAWSLVLVPVVGAVAVAAARSRRGVAAAAAIGSLAVTVAIAVAAAAGQWAGELSWGPRLGVTLRVEGLARLMVVLVPAIAAPVVGFAAVHERDDPAPARLLALMVAFVGAMQLLVAAGDFLALLLGWELVAAASWALIAHRWREAHRARAATEAFVVTGFGALGLYVAAGAAFAGTGSFGFEGLAGLRGVPLDVVAAAVLVAAAAKSAQVPFSPWLFAAMEGPTPVSALLHSATMVAAGAYALARIGPALAATGWFPEAVAALGLAGALGGGLVALFQADFKRALAGSTTANYGLVFVAVGAGSTFAAGAHLAAHAAFKALLFMGAGVAIHAAGTGHLGSLRLGRALRRTAMLFGVGALALAAVPPLGAAVSKEQILAAAAEAWPWAGAGVLVAAFLAAAYAGRLFLLGFGTDGGRGGRASSTEVAAMGILAGGSLVLGALWLAPVRRALGSLIGAGPQGAVPAETAASLAVAAAAVAGAVTLDRRGVLLSVGLPERARVAAAAWLGLPA